MDENNKFALVPKAPAPLEKVEPGIKRVLSGMVADTLVLVKRARPKKEICILMVCFPGKHWGDLFKTLIESEWGDKCIIRIICEGEMFRINPQADRHSFDLLILNAGDENNRNQYENLIASLKVKHRKPMIVWGTDVFQPSGADNYLKWSTWVIDLLGAIAMHFQLSYHPTRKSVEISDRLTANLRPRRIIILDDEPMLVELYRAMLKPWFDKIDVQSFSNGYDAWQYIERMPPDLLIMDRGHPGMKYDEILTHLLKQKSAYPVFVISGQADKEMDKLMQDYRMRGVNVTLLAKPYELDELYWLLLTHLGVSEHVHSTRLK